MPRIYDGNSEPHDFCRKCFPSEFRAGVLFDKGEGPDNRGNCFSYDVEHPDYAETDYLCETCGDELGDLDD